MYRASTLTSRSTLESGSGGSSAPNPAQACSCPPVDRIENTQRLLERCGSDAQLVPEGMVEPEDDEQQQAEQDGDRAQQAEMRTHAPQAHDTAEQHSGPQQSGYSRFGVQDSLIALRRQSAQLVEKLLSDRARRDAGPLT